MRQIINLLGKIAFTFLLFGYLTLVFAPTPAFGQRPNPKTIAAKFGGECQGTKYDFSARLRKLIEKHRQRTVQPCAGAFCEGGFAYDLNGDGRKEYFVRLSCGATGNCAWGIFSARSAKPLGVFTAWFFFIHKRINSWSKISTHTREGGDQGVIAFLAYRRTKYVQTAERTEKGSGENPHPFLKRMGMPNC